MTSKHFINRILLFVATFIFLYGCKSSKYSQNSKWYTNTGVLIPIFKNQNLIKGKRGKWGVIDKNGKKIVPFIYDGIKMISDSMGIATKYTSSYSLNTGIPRYVYCGKYYLFSKNGRVKSFEKNFSIAIVGYGDNHDKKFVARSPYKFVPLDTTVNTKTCYKPIVFNLEKNN